MVRGVHVCSGVGARLYNGLQFLSGNLVGGYIFGIGPELSRPRHEQAEEPPPANFFLPEGNEKQFMVDRIEGASLNWSPEMYPCKT